MFDIILKWPLVAYEQLMYSPMYGKAAAVGALAVGYLYGGVPTLDEGWMPLATQYLVTGVALAGLDYVAIKLENNKPLGTMRVGEQYA